MFIAQLRGATFTVSGANNMMNTSDSGIATHSEAGALTGKVKPKCTPIKIPMPIIHWSS